MAIKTARALTDIRDNVQHLRKIHFSLLVACFALFTLTFARGPNQFDTALAQLEEIRGALANWSHDWVDSAIDARAQEQPDILKSEFLPGMECPFHCTENFSEMTRMALPPFDGPVEAKGLRLHPVRRWVPQRPIDRGLGEGAFITRMPKLKERDRQFATPVPREYPVDIMSSYIDRPGSIQQFQAMWNTLRELTIKFALQGDTFWARIADDDGRHDVGIFRPDDPTEADWPVVDLALDSLDGQTAAWWRDYTEHQIEPEYNLRGYTLWGEVSVPVETGEFTVSLREEFVRIHDLPWSEGTFATNFPDLSAAMQGRSEITFDETKALLASESAQLDADITIFGLAIPARVVSQWGGAIVVLAQFYFWLHLRGFHRELRATAEPTLAPWIGIYDDLMARATTALSAFALPPLVLAAMISSTDTGTLTLWLIVLASLVLGGLTFLTLKSCWASIDTPAEPPSKPAI